MKDDRDPKPPERAGVSLASPPASFLETMANKVPWFCTSKGTLACTSVNTLNLRVIDTHTTSSHLIMSAAGPITPDEKFARLNPQTVP